MMWNPSHFFIYHRLYWSQKTFTWLRNFHGLLSWSPDMPSTAILWSPVPSHGPPPIRLLSRWVICHIRSYKINFRLCNINEWWKRHRSHIVANWGCNFVFHVTYLPISPKGRSRYEVFTVVIYNCQSNSNCTYRKILTYQTPQSNLPNGLFVNQNIAFLHFC